MSGDSPGILEGPGDLPEPGIKSGSLVSPTMADRPYQKDGKEREADFINVVAWKKTAEFVGRYFNKGSMIAIQGRIQTRKYTDRNGNNRTAFEVVADNVSFCGGRGSGSTAKDNTKAIDDWQADSDDGIPLARLIDGSDDDLPF